MPFTVARFLLVFLPAVLGLYFLAAALGRRSTAKQHGRFGAANLIIAAGSVVFLAGGGRTHAGLMALAAVLLFGLGTRMRRDDARVPTAVPELAFAFGVTGIAALYAAYVVPNPIVDVVSGRLVAFAADRFSVPGLVMPLGLTVFVCHGVSFVVDVYRRDAVVHRNPAHTAMYLLGFPFMVAGPLIRYRDISQQLVGRRIGMASFAYGVRRFTIGLAKVALIAHTLAVPANVAFRDTDALGLLPAWIGLACFSLQIYFELSGYADMALGIGRMLGFRLPENFNAPYAADTLRDFWRRWNISLTTWCAAYLRHPLGGASLTGVRPIRSLLLLFLAISLWHGPRWGVFIWGGVHALFMALERTRWGAQLARLPAPARHAYLLLVVAVSWVFFRADTVGVAVRYFQALGGLGATGTEALTLPLTPAVWVALGVGLVTAVPVLPAVGRWTVTVDALATALQMIMTTAAMYVWVRVFGQRAPQRKSEADRADE